MQNDSADKVISNLQKKLSNNEKIEAMVYAMADKFLDSWDLEKIREEIKMTRLGAMLYNDGIECGERQKLKKLVETVYQKGMSVEKIAELFNENVEYITELMREIKEGK